MFFKAFKLNKYSIFILLYMIFNIILFFIFKPTFNKYIPVFSSNLIWNNKENAAENSYIKWVDFTPTYEVLDATSKLDISSHNSSQSVKYNWIEILSYLACKYGGNFKNFNPKDLNTLIEKLDNGASFNDLTSNFKNYAYYYEAYDAVLHNFIGEYEIETTDSSGNTQIVKKYGIKAFSPIAKNYNYSHYDDFGASRSYGYKRVHLGNDLLGSIGTPIVAVESGTIEAIGWNQFGGWRIGIRSFDNKRYYYYAHLRKDHPYVSNLEQGQIVRAGDVIGYLGMTRL